MRLVIKTIKMIYLLILGRAELRLGVFDQVHLGVLLQSGLIRINFAALTAGKAWLFCGL